MDSALINTFGVFYAKVEFVLRLTVTVKTVIIFNLPLFGSKYLPTRLLRRPNGRVAVLLDIKAQVESFGTEFRGYGFGTGEELRGGYVLFRYIMVEAFFALFMCFTSELEDSISLWWNVCMVCCVCGAFHYINCQSGSLS